MGTKYWLQKKGLKSFGTRYGTDDWFQKENGMEKSVKNFGTGIG